MGTARFKLSDPLKRGGFRGDCTQDDYRYICQALRGEEVAAKTPLISHNMGRRLLDVIWISVEPIVHAKVVEVLKQINATGWGTYPVKVLDDHKREAPDYFGFTITGRTGYIGFDPATAAQEYFPPPDGPLPILRGLTVSEESWDGTDLFMSRDSGKGYIIATERVKKAFARNKVTNVIFTPIEDVWVPA